MFAGLVTEENKKWWTLGAVSFGLFMIMLDNTVVNVALPSIQRDLGVGLSELEWVVSGYALTFAALMLIGGKLADAYGRRLIFVLGIAVFTAASLACGLASTGDMLIGARVAQGVGAAMMNPATLSIIAVTFPPRQRGTAIGIWAGTSALALAIGPLIGGLLTEHASWNWIFFINVPVGVLGIAASFLLIKESRDETHERLDLPGLFTSGLGLFALTYGLIEANNYGWGSARIVGAFVVAAVSLSIFVLLERHRRAPMLDLTLFRNRTYVGANLVIADEESAAKTVEQHAGEVVRRDVALGGGLESVSAADAPEQARARGRRRRAQSRRQAFAVSQLLAKRGDSRVVQAGVDDRVPLPQATTTLRRRLIPPSLASAAR